MKYTKAYVCEGLPFSRRISGPDALLILVFPCNGEDPCSSKLRANATDVGFHASG